MISNDKLPPVPDAAWRRSFRRRLMAWYAKNARDLPWRKTSDPYAVWVSEIMLQQTQVATVRSYFERFLREFPTIAALAAADEERVLRRWEGLGYYRRARQLHRAARYIVQHHRGEFPSDRKIVESLPGIGRYTAGAILSISMDQRVPILEANTIRLHARLLALEEDPRAARSQRLLWSMAESVLPRKDVGRFNQALMELGSLVCGSGRPACEACPVANLCGANMSGLVDQIPPPKRKARAEAVRQVAALVRSSDHALLMIRYREGARWGGLWDFPRVTVVAEHDSAAEREAALALTAQTDTPILLGHRLATLRHAVTRYQITLWCYEASVAADAPARSPVSLPEQDRPAEVRWVDVADLDDYPLSSTGRKLADLARDTIALD